MSWKKFAVAPHVGAWIEIKKKSFINLRRPSHPTWVRGLKYHTRTNTEVIRSVAPHVGAWIEIVVFRAARVRSLVAPHVGAWIEMLIEYVRRIVK